jgi:ankyrin repeat protein
MKKRHIALKLIFGSIIFSIMPIAHAMDTKKKDEDPFAASSAVAATSTALVSKKKKIKDFSQLSEQESKKLIRFIRAFKIAYNSFEKLEKQAIPGDSKGELLANFATCVCEITLGEILRFFKEKKVSNDQLVKACEAFAQNKYMVQASQEERIGLIYLQEILKHQSNPSFEGAQSHALHSPTDVLLTNLINHIIIKDPYAIEKDIDAYKTYFNKPFVVGYVPLFFAVYSNEPQTVSLLLKHGANARCFNNQGLCALLLVNPDNEGELIERMLKKHGASVNIKDRDGVTLLMRAVDTSNKAIFDVLCINGALMYERDNQGRTAYNFTEDNLEHIPDNQDEHISLLKYMQKKLLEGVNEIDPSDDMTPLMTASQAGDVGQVMWLLAHGADVKKVGTYNKTKTAYNLAKDGAIKALLAQKGAQDFEAQHTALQAKKREEIRLKLRQRQQIKESIDLKKQSDQAVESVKDRSRIIKSGVFGLVFSRYNAVAEQCDDPVVIECFKDLLQRSLVRLLLDLRKERISPEDIEPSLGGKFAFRLVQAGIFLGLERLALMGFKKEKELNLIELARLIYSHEDKKTLGDSEKIENDIDTLLFMSMWENISPLTFENPNQDEQQAAEFFYTAARDAYKKLAPQAASLIRSIATVQDSYGNTPLHYILLFNSFELAKQLVAQGAVLEKRNAKNIAPLDLVIKMGNSDKVKDLLMASSKKGTKKGFRKSTPTADELVHEKYKDSATATAAAGTVPTDREIEELKRQADLDQVLLAARQAHAQAKKLADEQESERLKEANLAQAQAAKMANVLARQLAKKERRKNAKLAAELELAQQKLQAERKHQEDQALHLRQMQNQREQQEKFEAQTKERADQELQAREIQEYQERQKRCEEAQRKLNEAQQELNKAREQEKQLKEAHLKELLAEQIYKQHSERPDIYAEDEDDAPKNYTQWLDNHRLCYGTACELCSQSSISKKAQEARAAKIKEQLQRRKSALDLTEKENRVRAQVVKKESPKGNSKSPRTNEELKALFAENLKKVEQRLLAKSQE